ncbi:hypothetical protein LCGC14_2762350 [marine sediment metagenome]|uniref:Uncharacterized protein n=1 Tax=marine sediment metagenome TaxID=412755 RepID=A0A0F8YYJ7_9ZZZZ
MTVNDLMKELQMRVEQGYGDVPIYVEDSQEDFEIDSIQKNTHASVYPDYLIIWAGDKVRTENN